MSFEKRVDRIEMPRALRVDEELGRTVRLRAAINDRTIQLEILHLIKVGMEAEPVDTRRIPPGVPRQIESESHDERKTH